MNKLQKLIQEEKTKAFCEGAVSSINGAVAEFQKLAEIDNRPLTPTQVVELLNKLALKLKDSV